MTKKSFQTNVLSSVKISRKPLFWFTFPCQYIQVRIPKSVYHLLHEFWSGEEDNSTTSMFKPQGKKCRNTRAKKQA
jgi:hypothetical protein